MGRPTKASSWSHLGDPAPATLADARLQLHYPLQIVSSVGFTFVDPAPDFSHTNLGWSHELGALVSHRAPGHKPFQAALRFSDLTLLLIGSEGKPVRDFALNGRTVDDGYAWLKSSIEAYTSKPLAKPLFHPDHELPRHPAGKGAPLSPKPKAALEELSRWYANADNLLSSLRHGKPNASPVRCWPHHFDIAFLIHLDPGKDAEEARTVGVGLSPGDESYKEPYFYISPYPYPENDAKLPTLAGKAQWHTEGFVAAVLPASRLVPAASAETQRRQVEEYARSAVEACYRLLGSAG